MPPRRTLLLIVLIALMHAALFIVYQRPDWEVAWSDQGGYQQLGAAMARAAASSRASPSRRSFIPEVIRTPGYPAFVAVIYRLFGEHTLPVAIAQALVFALICLIVYAIAKRVAGDRTATLAAVMTALFPPLPYYGALVLTEVWTTFMMVLACLVCLRAIQQRSARAISCSPACCSARPRSSGPPSCCCRSDWPSRCRCWCRPSAAARRRLGQWAAFGDRRGHHAGAVVHL